MTAASTIDAVNQRSPVPRDLLGMVLKIAFIIFTVEALIMMVLFRWDDNPQAIYEGILDSTCLTVIASPLIYLWVVRPFAHAARTARTNLTSQLAQSQHLLDQNEKLSADLQKFSKSTAGIHERVLEKIGADLHDGPAQLLTFTLLKLNRLIPLVERAGDKKNLDDLTNLTDVLGRALREVRDISTGLSLPELRSASMTEAIQLAVRRHQEFTGSQVTVDFDNLPEVSALSQKICAYRFVQEGLSNAFRHGRSTTPRVAASGDTELEICVSDDGCGFDLSTVSDKSLGLNGMRARVQALGGRFNVSSELGHGTTVIAKLRIQE